MLSHAVTCYHMLSQDPREKAKSYNKPCCSFFVGMNARTTSGSAEAKGKEQKGQPARSSQNLCQQSIYRHTTDPTRQLESKSMDLDAGAKAAITQESILDSLFPNQGTHQCARGRLTTRLQMHSTSGGLETALTWQLATIQEFALLKYLKNLSSLHTAASVYGTSKLNQNNSKHFTTSCRH